MKGDDVKKQIDMDSIVEIIKVKLSSKMKTTNGN
jgi:hypothetical protein